MPANAIWAVSENLATATAAFREPLPCSTAISSGRSRFRQFVSIVNSGYRIRYPHVAVATSCSTGREEGRPRKAGSAESIDIMLLQFNLSYYFYA